MVKNNVYLGHRAKKRLGQNFLIDRHIINDVISAIKPRPQQVLVEIGPGLGSLTEPLCSFLDELSAIELDRDLAERLRSHSKMKNKLTVYNCDAMGFDFSRLMKENKKIRIIGNLPYYISTPLIFQILKFYKNIMDVHFMLQKEVAARLSAAPGTKNYGRLTVMAGYYYSITPLLEVPSSAFFPVPKVESVMVKLTPHEILPFPATNLRQLDEVCRQGFNQRRKMARNCFKSLADSSTLGRLDIDPSSRPETLTLRHFVALANWIAKKNQD